MSEGLTAKTMLKAFEIMKENERLRQLPRDSNYHLQRRCIVNFQDTLAVVRAGGFVYPMGEYWVRIHREVGWKMWGSRGLWDYVEEQLIEQGV